MTSKSWQKIACAASAAAADDGDGGDGGDDGGGGGDGDDGSYIHFGWSCLDMKKKKMMISEKNCN